jgi:hypothetical protein
MQFTVYKFRSNKKKRDVHVKQIINMFPGLGKESGGEREDISSMDKNSVNL